MIKILCISPIPDKIQPLFHAIEYGIRNCKINDAGRVYDDGTTVTLLYYELEGEPIKSFFQYANEHELKFNISINGFYSCAGLNSSFIYLENLQMSQLIQINDKSENSFREYEIMFKFGSDNTLTHQVSDETLEMLEICKPFYEKGDNIL